MIYVKAAENYSKRRVKSKDYHDKQKKNAAYNKLLEKYKLIDQNADRDTVVKKINTFRTHYRREKKKVEESCRSGSGTDEIYEPTLWYYPLLNFLGDQETPRNSSSNLNERHVSLIFIYLVLISEFICTYT